MNSRPMRMCTEPVSDAGSFDGVVLGKLVGFDSHDRPLVTFKGGAGRPVIARVATSDPTPPGTELDESPPVLLMFEDGDRHRPIVVGFVREALGRGASPVADKTRSIELNGKTLIFEGQEEIVLRCGQGSLTIRADGQIVVKGSRLVSRASQTNKIRGASVQIN